MGYRGKAFRDAMNDTYDRAEMETGMEKEGCAALVQRTGRFFIEDLAEDEVTPLPKGKQQRYEI